MKNRNILKTIIPAVLLAGAVIAVILLITRNAGSSPEKKNLKGRVIGYLPYYSTEYVDNIDFSAITHLYIAFTNPDESGNLSNGIGESTLKNIIKKCHDNGVYAVASFGGGSISSKNYNALMRNNPSGIKNFDKKIAAYLDEYDFDGVDIDFEFIASSPAWEYFEAWMKDLREVCTNNNYILTSAVAAWYLGNMSDESLKCFDYICVMGYDNDGSSENHSTYEYAVKELNNLEARGISKDKIVLGVPFYGYKYTSGKMDWSSAASYRYILSKNSDASHSDYCDGYAYNGPETIRKKAELSLEYGGIMCWELSQDASGKSSLLGVIKRVYE